MMGLADKTIANCKALVAATEARASEKEHTDLEKQSLYVAASLDRCRRCGDHTMSLIPAPPLSLLCVDCEETLRATDGGLMWFSEVVAQISNTEDSG